MMSTELSPEQRLAISACPDGPVEAIDPVTKRTYFLLSAEAYVRLKQHVEEQFQLADTFPAQLDSAMRAGWADSNMDEYDDYERHRP